MARYLYEDLSSNDILIFEMIDYKRPRNSIKNAVLLEKRITHLVSC